MLTVIRFGGCLFVLEVSWLCLKQVVWFVFSWLKTRNGFGRSVKTPTSFIYFRIEVLFLDKSVLMLGIGGAGAITIKRMKENLNVKYTILDTKKENALSYDTVIVGKEILNETEETLVLLENTDISTIKSAVADYEVILICVGLGGKAGTTIAPQVAKIAKEQGKIVIAVAYIPFAFEGKLRNEIAKKSTNSIATLSDCCAIVYNDTLNKVSNRKQTLSEAFSKVDSIIFEIIDAITAKNSLTDMMRDLERIIEKSNLIESCK